MGPTFVSPDSGVDIGPHPHIGLHTVTWLVAGEILHRDSLGTEQLIRPGQLNLMTAGNGVSHSEEATSYSGDLHGVQLWIAQPEAQRHGEHAFEHHCDLPVVEIDRSLATVLIGSLGSAESTARHDGGTVGFDALLRPGRSTWPLNPAYEHGLIVLEGSVQLGAQRVVPGEFAYLGRGRSELTVDAPDHARVLIIGGTPFEEPILMWWNFVARTREEITRAYLDWTNHHPRFGEVASQLPRMPVAPPLWLR